jgi:NRPS condensation-like uncharacterized protein
MIHFPFSKTKRYLTGIDWLVHVFNYMTKLPNGSGNKFQVVLELDGVPVEDEFRKCLSGLIRKYPVLSGRSVRDYNLAPYWKMPPAGQTAPLSFNVHRLEDGADVFPLLEQAVNEPFNSEQEHLAFHLIYAGEKSFVAITFDHRLFDARGADAFLNMLQQEFKEKGNCSRGNSLLEPIHLPRWSEIFKIANQLNKRFSRLAKNAPSRVLPLPSALNRQDFRFKIVTFDEQQKATIVENANRKAGYSMIMPYMLAVAVRVMHMIFLNRGMDTGDCVIPITIDLRPPKKLQREIFFNQWSLLLFRIKEDEVSSFPRLLESIKLQMYDQVKSKQPQDIWEAIFLMRMAPLAISSNMLRLYLKKSSFCFSYVGESDYAYTFPEFMGEKVHNIFYMPRVPIPPGLGIYFHQFRGKLNAVISYLQGLLKDDEVNTIVDSLYSELGV